MILVVCTDDDDIEVVAERLAHTQPAIYGACYKVFRSTVPVLGRAENLFLTAHGAYVGDDGNSVIGDSHEAFYLNAVDGFENLAGIFPRGYSGNVYISACESSDRARGGFSFAEVFKARLAAAHASAGKVYGQHGGVGLTIPAPGDRGWIEA